MKKIRLTTTLYAIVFAMSLFAQYDDMYFIPQKKEKKESVIEQKDKENYNYDNQEIVYSDNQRDVDEYNRRLKSSEEIYNSSDADSSEIDEVSTEEYEYSKRILRFATPSVGIPVSSPLYWDLRYGPNSIYWDIYDDGVYAYVYPSTWNNWYYGWGWSSYYPYWGWRDPWHYGWYDPWYYGYNPYYPHYYYPHYGHHHPHWGPPGHHPGNNRPEYRPSTQYREKSSLARGNGNRTNSRTGIRTATTSRRNNSTPSRSQNHSSRNSINTNRSSAPTRSSYSQSNSYPSRSSSYNSSSSGYTGGSSRSSFSTPSRSSSSLGGFAQSRSGGGSRGRR